MAHILVRPFEQLAARYGYKTHSVWHFVNGEIALTKADKPHLVDAKYRPLNGAWRAVLNGPYLPLRIVSGIAPGKRHGTSLPCGGEKAPRLWLEFEPEPNPEGADRLSCRVVVWFSRRPGKVGRICVEESPLVRLAECVAMSLHEAMTLVEELEEAYAGDGRFRDFARALEAYRGGVLV